MTPPADNPPIGVPETPETVDGGLVRSSSVVALGTLLSRVTGLVRTVLLAAVLGARTLSAAYNAANTTPNMIYDLMLGGVLSATLVPTLVSNRHNRDEEGTSAVLSVAAAALVVITVLGFFMAPAIIGFYAWLSRDAKNALDPATQDLAVTWLRLFSPQILFYGLTSLATAHLNAHRRFAAAAVAPVVNNVWMIVLLLVVRNSIGDGSAGNISSGAVTVLGVGTTLGIAAMAAVLWPAITRAGLALRWHLTLRHPSVRQVARLSGWTIGFVIANQVTFAFITGWAGTGYSYWTYAYLFFQLPYGVFTVSIMTAFTPGWAVSAELGALNEFRARFAQGLRLVLITVLPSMIAFALLARFVVAGLLARWSHTFLPDDIGPTADTLTALAWGMVGFSVYLYVLRAFTARKDTKSPFLLNIFENALTLLLAYLLATKNGLGWGVQGLAWAWSLAYQISAIVALIVLHHRLGPTDPKTTRTAAATILRLVAAASAMALTVTATVNVLPAYLTDTIATLIISGTTGLGTYLAVLYALHVHEVRDLPRKLLRH